MFFISFFPPLLQQMDYRIKEIIAKVDKDISYPFVIEELAASVNLSASRFQHLFKREIRIGVVKYINNLRLEKARFLLETTHLRVKEIRLRIGIDNESHFQHDFKKRFGKSPCEYRSCFLNGADAAGDGTTDAVAVKSKSNSNS